VISEAVELRRGRRNTTTNFFAGVNSENWYDVSMTTEQIQAVLQREKCSRTFPSDRPAPFRVSFPRETVFLDDENLEDDDEPFTPEEMARLVAEMSQARGKRQKRVVRDLPGQGDLF